ncbi:phosphotransferase [Glaciecola sp. MH2013]|uniref:phosphotransferase n=1 Tax=Glaciecola sp. MH2013 TaxID=2785524 RepID=UPI00189E174C|nr:phosphotransferase [Glaciecola sp. MH2013]MBF7072451.1 phosphotransferase [Glaciecola sp. MH2013]
MQIDALLAHLSEPLHLSENAVLLPLSGGTINGAFYLVDNKNEYMVKCFEASETVDINRLERFRLQERLAKKRIAPRPIYLSAEACIYVEQWVKQHRSQIPLFFDELHINLLAKTLSNIHRCKIELPIANLPVSWQHYLSSIPTINDYTHERVAKATQAWESHRRNESASWVLCHNDLAWAHVCVPTKLILDWEYAALGNRFFDLLSCAKVNKFDNEQHEMLVAAYAKQNDLSIEYAYEQCGIQAEFVDLTYSLWYKALGMQNA